MLARRLVAAVAVVGLLMTAPGCSSAEYKQQRLENLDAAIEEFDATSLGEVLCDVHGGEVALGKGYTHTYLFAGRESWEPIAERFDTLDYDGDAGESSMFYSRSDGIAASAHVVEHASDEPELVDELEATGCDASPEGNLFLRLTEGDAGSASNG